MNYSDAYEEFDEKNGSKELKEAKVARELYQAAYESQVIAGLRWQPDNTYEAQVGASYPGQLDKMYDKYDSYGSGTKTRFYKNFYVWLILMIVWFIFFTGLSVYRYKHRVPTSTVTSTSVETVYIITSPMDDSVWDGNRAHNIEFSNSCVKFTNFKNDYKIICGTYQIEIEKKH